MVRMYALATLVLLCLGVLAAVVYTQRGYPDTVYYERVTIAGPALQPPVQQVEIWVDPRRDLELRVNEDGAFGYTTLIDQRGRRIRVFRDGEMLSEQMSTAAGAEAQVHDWQQLRRGGFRALADDRLASAVGPVAHVPLDGRDALRFDTARHDGETQRLTVWIDARTHDPLQLQVQSAYYTYTQRVDRMRRIDPGTLPLDFFDPPRPANSYWAIALRWLRDRIR